MECAEDQADSENVICPYCQSVCFQPEGEDYSEDYQEWECDCGKKFYYWQEFSVDHCAMGDCKLNGEDHDYQPTSLGNGESHPFCTKCGKCQPHKSITPNNNTRRLR